MTRRDTYAHRTRTSVTEIWLLMVDGLFNLMGRTIFHVCRTYKYTSAKLNYQLRRLINLKVWLTHWLTDYLLMPDKYAPYAPHILRQCIRVLRLLLQQNSTEWPNCMNIDKFIPFHKSPRRCAIFPSNKTSLPLYRIQFNGRPTAIRFRRIFFSFSSAEK